MFFMALTLLLPMATGQYVAGVRPDVRFDERSDRFDVSPLMDMGAYEEAEYRRSMQKQEDEAEENNQNVVRLTDDAKEADDRAVSKVAALIKAIARRANTANDLEGEWAWHDDMQSDGTADVYEKNLEQFKVNSGRRSLNFQHGHAAKRPASRRINVGSVNEVLLNHAVPITMNVKGFFKVPDVKAE